LVEHPLAILIELENAIRPPYNHDEMLGMLKTCGYQLVEVMVQKRQTPSARFFIGEGKLSEIQEKTAEDSGQYTVVFNHNLTPTQIHNLSERMKVRVIDRKFLILEIFELHSTTRESKLQIQLARLQLEYALRKSEVRERVKGEHQGRDFKGKGEGIFESFRRDFRKREASIREELREIEKQRGNQRKLRVKQGVVSIVGYTNAGKTALLNILTHENLPSRDELFTTLTTTTRQYDYKGQSFLVTDTVGFIADLPEDLLKAFMTTLQEILYSQGILLIIDVSEPKDQVIKKMKVSQEILAKIGAMDIPLLNVFNKMDLVPPEKLQSTMETLQNLFPNSVFISALTGENLKILKEQVLSSFSKPREMAQPTEQSNRDKVKMNEPVDVSGEKTFHVKNPSKN